VLFGRGYNRGVESNPSGDRRCTIDRKPLLDESRTNAATEDDLVEEWSGAESEIRFAGSVEHEE